MSDNITVKDSGGSAVVLGAKDLASVFLVKHLIVDDAGDIAQVVDLDGAIDERVDGCLATAANLFAQDTAAAAGSQQVALLVTSTAAPNLRVTHYDGANKMPAGDAVGRPIFVRVGNGTLNLDAVAEDAAESSGVVGLVPMAVRRDAAASSSGTTGDYSTLNTDATGLLWSRSLDGGPAWTSAFGVSSAAFVSADASAAATAVTDAPTGTQKIVLADLIVSVGTAMTVTFTCETTGVIIFRLYMAANTTQVVQLRSKVKLATADKKLMVQTSVAGNVSVTAGYYSEA